MSKSRLPAASDTRIEGVIIGVVTAVGAAGAPLVAYAGNQSELPIAAKSTVPIDSDAIGREAALLFEEGDVTRPIIMGLIHNSSLSSEIVSAEHDASGANSSSGSWIASDTHSELKVDGKRVELNAEEEIVLKCGKASITMTRSGKVIIRGAYVSTRSSGANRIKGGSVQIN